MCGGVLAEILMRVCVFAGLSVSCIQQVCVAFAWTKPLSIVAVAIGALGNISFPAISAIKSKSVPRHEQVFPAIPLHLHQSPSSMKDCS